MPADTTTYELTMRRTFSAPRSRVFAAWTQPELLARWFGPDATARVSAAEVDLRVGGQYRVAFECFGEAMAVSGTFQKVRAPSQLKYTWMWDHMPLQSEESTITVEFVDLGPETEIVLTHSRLSSEESKTAHGQGWTGSLENLARYLEQE